MNPRGKPFKKGHKSPGPGRPRLPEELREIRTVTKTEVLASMSKFLRLDLDGLKDFLNKTNMPVLDHLIARILVAAIKGGDAARLNFLLDRLIGRVQNDVKITAPKPVLIEYLNGDKDFLGQEQKED